MQKTITYYSVCLTDGIHEDGTACIYERCGHLHRTEAAGRKCHEKLLNWDKARRNCSAKWYNASILEVDRAGRHDPQPDLVACGACGKAVPVEDTIHELCYVCANQAAERGTL